MMVQNIVNITGVSESRSAFTAAEIFKKNKGRCLIIAATGERAERIAVDLSFFTGKNAYVIPSEDYALLDYEAKNRDRLFEKMRAFKALFSEEDCIVVVSAATAAKKMPPHNILKKRSFVLQTGSDEDIETIKSNLAAMGYERETIIDGRGQFALRGDILDIFTADSDNPCRIEFFDREIESIRIFDVDTQRSVEKLSSVEIYPASQFIADEEVLKSAVSRIDKAHERVIKKLEAAGDEESFSRAEALSFRRSRIIEYAENLSNVQLLENYIHYFYDKPEHIWDYMDGGTVIIDDPDRVFEAVERFTEELSRDFTSFLESGRAVPEDKKSLPSAADYYEVFSSDNLYILSPFTKRVRGITEFSSMEDIKSAPAPLFNGQIELLSKEIGRFLKRNYEVNIVCSTEDRLENIRQLLVKDRMAKKVHLSLGNLTSGVDFPERKICYISDNDIFGGQKRRKRKANHKFSQGEKIASFAEMKKGDYVVHEHHGIGKFIGIEQMEIAGEAGDYLKIKYDGRDMLYVPVCQMDIVQRYIGSEAAAPKLNKLSGTEWQMTKARVRAAIKDMADDLIKLSAQRKAEGGYAFSPDTEWQKDFEDAFPYAETYDQLRCISEIKADMEKPVAMDRLLCGDVGFGKTEVAARAIFKCLADGMQAVILAPTTILANQHYYTLKDRLRKFPFNVEVMSRFKSSGEQNEIVKKLEKGEVDLVIGTHRLLSKDVKFKNLGLLVIDEEQRFGVQHKEAIKLLKKNVDVLALSATPIPRTLHMSLVGIRDMSIIEEAPEERYPVQTYVMEEDDRIIRDAISRELDRNGQVYVVYNRVKGINAVANRISELVPGAEIAVAHGQLGEKSLENIMVDFIDGEYNVLVSTTIIESGLDIPNVNTMIILNADMFGLSQLYQLRGRVGRSNRMAYAYLFHQPQKVLTEIAAKRLRAIREFTEFGSGFKIAMRDLEIRGAGNILGAEQHGHMVKVGYELYCKLVDEAVRNINDNVSDAVPEETNVEFTVSAYIPAYYITDEAVKLQMYKKIAYIVTAEDEEDIKAELSDRFGEIPREVLDLIAVSRIRSLASLENFAEVSESGTRVVFKFCKNKPVKPEKISKAAEEYSMRFFMSGGMDPFIRIACPQGDKVGEALRFLEKVHNG